MNKGFKGHAITAAVTFVVTFIILALLGWCSGRRERAKQKAFMDEVAPIVDSADVWRDELDMAHAKAEAIEIMNMELLELLGKKNDLIKHLNEVIRKERNNGGKGEIVTASVAAVEMRIDTIVKTRVDTVYPVARDRVMRWDTVFVQDEWSEGYIKFFSDGGVDSVGYDFKTKNRFYAIVTEENGFFKAPKYHLELVSENPHTTILDAKNIRVKYPREKRFGVGPMVGVGVSYDGKIHPIVGMGLQWNIIRF